MMEGFYVYLSSDASEQLYPGNTKANFTVNLSGGVQLDRNFEWRVALTEALFPADGNGKIDTTETNAGPIFIYLDIVEPSRVGDSSSKLLRIVTGNQTHETFSDRYYIPTKENRIPKITALLSNRLGVAYPFRAGKTPVVLVLHFTPKRSI